MKNKRICLIETRSPHFHVYSFAPIPRLGAIQLGTILHNHGYDVDVFIEDLCPIDMDVVRQADLVGISLITATAPRSYRLADAIRRLGIPVVLGGAHVSFMPEDAARHADYCLCGEADESIVAFVDGLFDGGDLSGIPGLVCQRDREIVFGPPSQRPQELDRNPFPDFSLVRAKSLFRITSISTSRGCPFDCSFCSVTTFNGKSYRTHSVDYVLDQIQYQFSRHAFRFIFFADDIFNANKQRMARLLEGMVERGNPPAWGAQVRHEVTRDDDLVALMKRAHCKQVFVGFESINPRALALYNKHETVEDIERSIEVFHRHGVMVHGMFVLGCDEDTIDTVRNTLRFAIDRKIDTVQFMVLTPLPGSRDYQQYARGERSLLSRNWDLYDGHHVLYEPKLMTAYELQAESQRTMRKFYGLRRAFGPLLRGNLPIAYFRYVGWRIVRAWHREPANCSWLSELRQRLHDGARKLAGGDIPVQRTAAVAVFPSPSSRMFRPALEQFLTDLGAKVEHGAEDLTTVLSQGRQLTADSVDSATDLLSKWFRNLGGRAHLVLAPKETELRAGLARLSVDFDRFRAFLRSPGNELPRVLYLPEQRLEIRRWLFQLGLIFTDDLGRIRQACARVLEMLELEEAQTDP